MMILKDKNILVIGGAGFIGSHVVEELIKEPVKEIIVYDNFCRGTHENLENVLKDKRVRIYENGGDITQIDLLDEAVSKTDYVIHLAALWLLHCYSYPRSAFKTNIEGTFNVLESCVKHKIKRLVYSSSASVYGNALTNPMTEEHPFNNRTFYGATKIACEQMCRAFNERYGLDYVALRYMNVYGDRQDYKGAYVAVIMKIIDRISQGLPPIIYGDGTQSYDFVFVEDVARANILALKNGVSDQCYNVGIGVKTTINELTQIILEITNSKLKPVYEPQGQSFVTERLGSTEKAEVILGFKAKIGLEEGIKRLIEWRKSQGLKI